MVDEVREIIKKGDNFLLTTHIHHDGDSVASELALALTLKKLGKRFHIFNNDPVPYRYKNFPYIELATTQPPPFDCEFIFVLDCASLSRTGKIREKINFENKTVINIDHHMSNERFGDINIVQPVSSTSEIIYDIIKDLVEIDRDIATYIYMGISTDTGGFRYPNTTSHSLEIASLMVKLGADPGKIGELVWFTNPERRIKLLGKVLTTLDVRDGVAFIHVTRRMMEELGANEDDTEEFVDFPLSIEGVKVAVFLKERDGGVIKASLRSKKGVNVEKVAREFGGGGHKNASGFEVNGYDMEKLKEVLMEKICLS